MHISKTENLTDPELPLAILVLMLFALLYSYLLVNTQGFHQPLVSYPVWQGSSWIQASGSEAGKLSGKGYFRKNFSISSLQQRAYLVISSSDGFSVFINGEALGFKKYFANRPSDIVDITRQLQLGDNLLAVMVDSDIQGVVPEMIAKLVITDVEGGWREVGSDSSWLVSRVDAYQYAPPADWSSPLYNDLHWSSAEVDKSRQSLFSLALNVPELVFKTFPRGPRIWSGNGNMAAIEKEFMLQTDALHAAWLGVSFAGRYSLVINGKPVVSQQGNNRTMELYDVGSYLQPGLNSISFELESEQDLSGLMVNGIVATDRDNIVIDSASGWAPVSSSAVQISRGVAASRAVYLVSHADVTADDIVLVFKEITSPLDLVTEKILTVLKVFVIVLAASTVLFVVFLYMMRTAVENTFTDKLSVFVRPFILGVVILAAFQLIACDPSVVDVVAMQSAAVIVVPVLVVSLEALIYLQVRYHDLHARSDG